MKFHSKNNRGFTLIEMIIYVLIFSMIFTLVLVLFGRVQKAGGRSQVAIDLRENAEQVMHLIGHSVREANSISVSGSVFGTDEGRVTLVGDDTLVFDTHVQQIVLSGVTKNVRRIKMTKNGQPAVNITSNRVHVERFRLTDLSGGGSPRSFQLELALSSVNPGDDPDYAGNLVTRSYFTLREDL